MDNKEIARSFRQLADLMELHGENPFRTRTYANAYISLRKVDRDISMLDEGSLASIKGIGSSVAKKIRELVEHGKMDALEKYREKTPEGIRQILSIKGIGPKKVRQIWEELGVESPGELLYACQENRLVDLKGFGLKTQQDYIAKIEYFLDSQEKSLYASIEDDALALLEMLRNVTSGKCVLVGEVARKCPVISSFEILVEKPVFHTAFQSQDNLEVLEAQDDIIRIRYADKMTWSLHPCTTSDFGKRQFELTADAAFISAWNEKFNLPEEAESMDQVFRSAGIPVPPSEIMEGEEGLRRILADEAPGLVSDSDIKGILHNHSTYSDGLHSLREMAEYVKASGYAYFGICDHSQSAFYANGMPPERVLEQHAEIDLLNRELAPFKVYKGIESDILNDGSLDYEEEILARFDFVVASIHSNLRMDKDKATERLIRAIENPYTRMLGHPTGRLLLSREGYPIDHMEVIDACAHHHVAIELNANPLRLDLEYTWIPYAVEKGVLISINPDAHSKGGIHLTRFGVIAARKGWLPVDNCLNALGPDDFQAWINAKKV